MPPKQAKNTSNQQPVKQPVKHDYEEEEEYYYDEEESDFLDWDSAIKKKGYWSKDNPWGIWTPECEQKAEQNDKNKPQ